jgi:hypothetical protein
MGSPSSVKFSEAGTNGPTSKPGPPSTLAKTRFSMKSTQEPAAKTPTMRYAP